MGLIAFFTFTIICGCFGDIVSGDDCSCDGNGGCDTTNKCSPNSNNCVMKNVALGKWAEMSSTYRGGNGVSGPACLAVNGNRSHVLVLKTGQSTDRLNCIHTDADYTVTNARWSVDLGAEYTVTGVTIYNRNINFDSLSNAMLTVDDKLCKTITNSNNLVLNVTCRPPVRGQNVTLRTTTKSGKKFFNFCELEVWVCSAGRYGATCGQLCSSGCSNGACDNYNGTCLQGCKAGFYGDLCDQTCGHCKSNAACDQKTGNCTSGCEEGWKPPLCTESDSCWYDTTNRCWPDSRSCLMENVALGKPAEMSSTYTSGNTQSGPACLAVNGNRSHVMVLKTGQSTDRLNCIHTVADDKVKYARWSVDLGAEYTVNRVTIYNRDTNRDSLRNAVLFVDRHYCQTVPNSNNWQVLNVTCREPVRGQNVTLRTRTDNTEKRFFNFCELELWVCSAGRYGATCGQLCSSRCSNGACDNYNGTCLQGCQGGFHGDFCDQTCGHCKNNITCDHKTGNCLSGCEVGWQPPLCTEPCSPGSYGENCRQQCGQCKGGNTTCDIITGGCEAGCQPGYQSAYCDRNCYSGFYGDGCTNKCGKCAKPPCHHVTGVCTGGCDKGYQGQLCNEVCSPGSYGADCKQSCGQCKGGNTECNTTSGVCESGCQPGYVAAYCNQTCNRGFYGDACSHWCGNCRQGDCEHVNGTCPGGCVAGYTPPLCNKICDQGFYGYNCSNTCGNCSHGAHCEPVSGVCPGGCQAGYQPPFCNETCSKGYHGINCSYPCGNCSQTGTCSPVDGACSSGCQGGFQPPYCNTTCDRGFHGDNCVQMCGYCAVDTCHHETGVCSSGCQSGYHGELCKQVTESGGGSAGRVGGAVVGVIILVLIGVVVFFVVRNKRRKERKSDMALHHHTNTNREENDYQPMAEAALNSSPSIPPIKPRSSPKPPHNHNSSAATQPTGDNLYMNVPEHTVTAMPTPSSSNSLGKDFGDERGDDDDDDDDDDVYTNDSLYATFRASSPQLDRVQRALVDRLASDQLPEEFKELLKGLTDDHKVAKLNSNIKKNRYASVLPYDYNRVILNDGFREGTATDYVNASYITGFRQEKKYIAAQGPRTNTIADFWRMVWQENVTQIVMVTNTVEAGQDKCAEYWPAQDSIVTYGPVTVTAVDVRQRANFIIRTFVLKMRHDNEEREVEQYHYLAWPDHGVPTTTSLLNFWRFARSRAPRSPPPPVLVHCTAGVGRTGTYIALDIAFDEAVARGEVNVFDVVKRMRKQRCIMVQTLVQYVFLHKILLEAYTGRSTSFLEDNFEVIFTEPVRAGKQNSVIDAEFRRIMLMRSLTPELTYAAARDKENTDKNRSSKALPSDEHRVFLTAHVPRRNQYINAVFMPSYLTSRGSILTQLPLPSTLVDFWRLVDGNDVITVVSLGSPKEAEAKDSCQYWPVTSTRAIQADPYVVSLKTSSKLDTHLTLYQMSVQKKGSEEKRDVSLVRFDHWSEEIPGNTSELLTLISFVDKRRQVEDNSSPVVIQCMDGVAKSGLFNVLCDVISRLTFDKEVDVYMTVRELHNVRPQALTSVAQYRYCYEVAQQRFSETSMYANTS